MKPSADLHTLIHSLSPSERRYFRMFTRIQESAEEWNYLRLFDAILKQEQYDEAKIKENFAGSGLATSFAVEKHYLFQQILKSLKNFRSRKRKDLRLREMLEGVEILASKGMHKAARKMLANAKKLAEKLDILLFKLEIHEWERRLRKGSAKKNKRRTLDELDTEGEALHARAGQELAFHQLYDRFSDLTAGGVDLRQPAQRMQLESLLSNPLLADDYAPEGLRVRTLYHQMKGTAAFYLKNQEVALRHFSNIHQDWVNHPHLIARHPDRFLRVIGNYLTALEGSPQNALILPILSEIKLIKRRFDIPASPTDAQEYHFALRFYLNSGQLAHALIAAREMEDFLSKFGKKLSPSLRLSFGYNLLTTYFLNAQFSDALSWANFLITNSNSEKSGIFGSLGRIFELILHYELDNHDLLEYLVRNSRAYFRKQGAMDRFEVAVLNGMKALLQTRTSPEKTVIFSSLFDSLSTVSDQNLPGATEVVLWANSRANGTSLTEIATSELQK